MTIASFEKILHDHAAVEVLWCERKLCRGTIYQAALRGPSTSFARAAVLNPSSHCAFSMIRKSS
jgi:hypothetical protein